ncbi:MAG: PD40 domain-containing protein [Ktedonobacterales bacterium]|nr:PD40 domain-containing protein [Ktedonobacterales bacterium]
MKRQARRTVLLAIGALLSLVLLAGCGGGATDGAGTNLGSGPLLAFIGGDGNLWLAKGDGSLAHAVTVTPCPVNQSCYGPPAWSPDGTSVALFGPDAATPSYKDIYVYNRQGLLQQTIHPVSPLAFGHILWSSDGKQVAYVGNPDALAAGKSQAPRYALVLMVVSSGAKAGAIILPSPGNAQCGSDPRGGPLGSLVERAVYGSTGQGLRDTLGWTPDGQKVAINGGSCGTQVQIVNRGGSAQLLVPVSDPNANNVVQAQFSPDGQHLLATQTSSQQDDILIYNADGSGGKSIYSDTSAPPAFTPRLGAPSWSADGKLIYFMHGESIWQIGADGANPHQLVAGSASGNAQKSEAAPLPSPDGQHLVWNELSLSVADNTARTELLGGDANGENAKVIADGGVWPAYSAK